MKHLRQMQEFHDLDWNLWSDIFTKWTHIYLTRRNKTHQSVSWWKAIQDQQWHLEKGTSREKEVSFYQYKYNFHALLHLLKECMLREAMADSYFDHNHLIPYTIVYEDLIRNYTVTIDQLIGHIAVVDTYTLKEKPIKKTANEINEAWSKQFQNDIKKTGRGSCGRI